MLLLGLRDPLLTEAARSSAQSARNQLSPVVLWLTSPTLVSVDAGTSTKLMTNTGSPCTAVAHALDEFSEELLYIVFDPV